MMPGVGLQRNVDAAEEDDRLGVCGRVDRFDAIVEALQNHWTAIAPKFPGVEDIRVIGIDLTKRGLRAKAASAKRRAKKTDLDGATPSKRLPKK